MTDDNTDLDERIRKCRAETRDLLLTSSAVKASCVYARVRREMLFIALASEQPSDVAIATMAAAVLADELAADRSEAEKDQR